MSHIDNVWIFHSHPSGEHSPKRASKGDNRTIFTIGFFDKFDKLSKIHDGFLSSEIDKIFLSIGCFLITKWHALSKISMLWI
jgi:hypothetical protein